MLQDLLHDLEEGLIQGLLYEYLTRNNTWEPVYIRSVSLREVELVPRIELGETKLIDGIPFGANWDNKLLLSFQDIEKRLRRAPKEAQP